MDTIKTGLLIAQARKGKALTQKDVAQALHVSVQAVSKWERGLNFPDLTLLEPLAELLDLSVSELLAGERGQQPQEPLVRDTLRALLLQMGGKVQTWRRLFGAALAFALLLLFGGGYLYVRDHTDWLPQRTTIVTPRTLTDSEALVARTVGGASVDLFELTVADDVSEYLLELELWTEEGLVQTWTLAQAGNWEDAPRRQTLIITSAVDMAEPLSTMSYGVTIDGVAMWNGTVELPYIHNGYMNAVLSQPVTLSPEHGAVLSCFSLDPAGQSVWRSPGWVGNVVEPPLEPGAAFLLLRLRCT